MPDVGLEAAEAVADVADDRVEAGPRWPVAQAAARRRRAGSGPLGSRGMLGVQASSTSSRIRSRRSTSRWRGTGTGSYSMPTTRSTARDRRSSSAGAVSRWTTSTCRSGAVSASRSSTPGRSASAGVCTNVIRRRPRGASPDARQLGADGLVGRERFRCVGGQSAAGRRQLDVAADATQQLGSGFAFELGELDGDRRRAVRERVGDRRHRSQSGQLVQKAQSPQFHRSDSRTSSRRESALVANGHLPHPGSVIVVSLLLAAVVMAAAALIERRLGPSAAGWVAALPIAFAVAVVAVSAGRRKPSGEHDGAERRDARPGAGRLRGGLRRRADPRRLAPRRRRRNYGVRRLLGPPSGRSRPLSPWHPRSPCSRSRRDSCRPAARGPDRHAAGRPPR